MWEIVNTYIPSRIIYYLNFSRLIKENLNIFKVYSWHLISKWNIIEGKDQQRTKLKIIRKIVVF